jgi:mycothiol synthase
MIDIRPATTARDLETWAHLKSTIVPNEPVTAAQLRASEEEGRILLLASFDGRPAGCGVASYSRFAGMVFVAARVLPELRRRGVGSALVDALLEHARSLGLDGLNAVVDAADPAGAAFAARLGLEPVDYQLEQRRLVTLIEPAPEPPPGIALVPLGERREERLREVWPIALAGYEDLPFASDLVVTLDEWLRDEATRPDGSFVALEGDEPVGFAGLLEHANGGAAAEHGMTVVRRDRRRRGIARALKSAQLHWASQNGVVEIQTWTQQGNEAMQELNRSLGYVDTSKSLTFQGPLPPA